MINEIEASHLVSYLAGEAGKVGRKSYSCSFGKLRNIGHYIEQQDKSIRVELSENSYHSFRSRNVRHISISRSTIKVDQVNSPLIQSLLRQYAPDSHVASLIQRALDEDKKNPRLSPRKYPNKG